MTLKLRNYFLLLLLILPSILYATNTPNSNESSNQRLADFDKEYRVSSLLLKDMEIRIYEVGLDTEQLDFFKKQLLALKHLYSFYMQQNQEMVKYWNQKLDSFEYNMSDSKISDISTGLKIFNARKTHLTRIRDNITKIKNIQEEINSLLYIVLNRRVQVSDRILFNSQSKFYLYETWTKGFNDITKNYCKTLCDIFNVKVLNRGYLGYKFWFAILLIYVIALKFIILLVDKAINNLRVLNRKIDLVHFYRLTRIMLIGYIPAHIIYLIMTSMTIPITANSDNTLAMLYTYACSISFFILLYTSLITLFNKTKNKLSKHFNIFVFSFMTFIVLLVNNINAFYFSTQLYPYLGENGVALINLIVTSALSIWGLIMLYYYKSFLFIREKLNILSKLGIFTLKLIAILSPVIIFIGYSNLIIAFLVNCLQTAMLIYFTYILYKVILDIIIIIIEKMYYWIWVFKIKEHEENSLVPNLHPNIIYWFNFFTSVIAVIVCIILIALAWGIPPFYIYHCFELIFFSPLPIGNNSTFTLYTIIHALIVFCVCFIISIIISDVIYDRVIRYTNTASATKFAVKKLIKYIGITISSALFVYSLGVDSKSLTFIISGLSIGVGFALKDTLSNFFAGIIVLIGRQIRVGDWIYSPDKSIEGIVEDIGLHSTKIRGFDKRPFIIPNSLINTRAYVNATFMSHRRIKQYFGVRYQDIKVVDKIIFSIREMLLEHPDIDKKLPTVVNLLGGDTKRGSEVEGCFGDYSVNIRIYTYTRTTHWIEFHKIQDEIMIKVAEIIKSYNAEIAFPTSNIIINNKVE